ncbi:hypothetical protein ACFJIX_13415 [Roseateles sp. UC29_93]|uniref:hypothetical protein n=1 Tax=Roseateles sp. UC29_93 TaxID=3350177 RepID=UPI00366D3782
MMFEELTTQEIALVSGGDSWAGTPEGRALCQATAEFLTGTASSAQAQGEVAGAYALTKTQNKSR